MAAVDAALRPSPRYRLLKAVRRLGLPLRWRPAGPAAFVTGSVGKTTACSMVAAILSADGRRVGLATSTGCFIGGRRVRRGDSSRPSWAAALLAHPVIDVGVFETARGGLLLDGFPFRDCTVGAVLNVHDNHLGLGGIQSREQLAQVKSAVAAAAGGLAVLNADEPLCMAMRPTVRATATCLVGRHPDAAGVREHLARGGLAAVLEPTAGDRPPRLSLRHGDHELAALSAAAIPATHGGRFEPAVTNALFAMAIAHGLGAGADAIGRGLGSFRSDTSDNPGRMNFHHGLPFTLVATKVGGRLAADALTRFVETLDVPNEKVLVVTEMGDRSHDWIRGMCRAFAPGFDRFVCCDWEDRRGRAPGEMARLLAEGFAAAGVAPAAITVEERHDAAIRRGCDGAACGDLVVVVSPTSWRVPEILGLDARAPRQAVQEAA
ncbi:MAG: Mur ligase family protein [Planctomycetaceae bacterium]